jgi:hypothetical protein
MWADIQDKRLRDKYSDKLMDDYRDKGMSPRDFLSEL